MSGLKKPFRAPPIVGETYREQLRRQHLRTRLRTLFAVGLAVVCIVAALAFFHAPGARASWRFETSRQGY